MKREHPLVAYLEQLAARQDRAALAALRGSLREGHALEALRYVLPFIGKGASRRDEDVACLVAGLFALHPESGSLTLAAALRLVLLGGSDSTEGLFIALLSAGQEDLPIHLRHAVSLVAGKDLPLDWHDLYSTVRFWDDERGIAKRRWAADFWASTSAMAVNPIGQGTVSPTSSRGKEL